jgi:uncharacterized membrane protein YesL
MWDGLRVFWQGLRNVNRNGYAYLWANIAFVVFLLPVVTAPAAYAALCHVAYTAEDEPHEADLALFWETFKAQFFRALPWGIVGTTLLVVNLTNILAYWNASGLSGFFMQFIWLLSLYFVGGVMLFTFPFYYEMEIPSISGAVINAARMVIANPFFTVTVILLLFALSLISTIFFAAWIILTWGIITAVANRAVQDRLMSYRQQRGVTG